MDVVDERSPVRLKETTIQKSNGGWIDFARDLNAIVLFASGFEDIIKPSQDTLAGLCHQWKRVPRDKDYLTASVSILSKLYEEAGSRLTRKHLTSTHLQWHRGQALFEPCPNRASYECTCDRLQQIFHESLLSFGKVNPPGFLEEQGAVIFGQSKHSTNFSALPHQKKKKDNIYSQANVPLLETVELTEVPISSSEISAAEKSSLPDHDAGSSTETSEEDTHFENSSFDYVNKAPKRSEPASRKRPRDDPGFIQEGPRPLQRPLRDNYALKRCHLHDSIASFNGMPQK